MKKFFVAVALVMIRQFPCQKNIYSDYQLIVIFLLCKKWK